MATYRVTAPDGSVYDITAPDNATAEQVREFVRQQAGGGAQQREGNAAAGGIAGGAWRGLRDPIDAGAQMLRRMVPEGVGRAVDAAGNWLADQGLPVARSSGVEGVDRIVRETDQQYEADRAAAGRTGFDGARLFGNVVNPVNAAVPSAAGARTLTQLATRGAAAGAVGGALQPVTEGTENFWTTKATQAAAGAAAGAVATPLIAKAGESAVKAYNAMRDSAPRPVTIIGGQPGLTRADLDAALQQVLQRQGMRLEDVPAAIQDRVRAQIADAVSSGRQLDPAMALRRAQFEAIGMTGDAAPTVGQMTRDPLQWAREQNLSGIMFDTPTGPQNALASRFRAQQQRLRGVFDNLGADKASDRVAGGEVALSALQEANKRADSQVRAAYDAFRQSTGKDMEVPLQGLAQDFAAVVDKFDDAIPGAVRKKFEALGLLGGQQRQVLTIDGAEKLIKIINANTDPANRRAYRALGELRAAVNKAVEEGADRASSGAGAEAAMLGREARDVARGVFQSRQDVRALQAAANDVAPDQFLQRFLLNPSAPTREVEGMAQVLRQDPAAWNEVRSQVAAYLKQAAFGADLAGDKAIAPDRFARALQSLGPQKLSIIFSPDEVVRLNIAAKVAAEMQSVPAGAQRAVNYSNTANGIFNLLQGLANSPVLRSIPGARSLANQAGEIANERAVSAALQAPQAATKPAPKLTPAQMRALSALFAPAGLASGAAAGSGQ